MCFLGITFNGVVIFTIYRNVHRRISAPTFLILSIAVSDFLSCAIPVPLSITRYFQKEWPFGLAGCQAHAFMIFLLALVSITHLVAISAGKYLTITRSLSRDSYFNKKKVILIILGLLTRLQRATIGRMVEIRPGRNKCYMLGEMGFISSKRSGILWSCNFHLLLFAPGRDHLLLLQDPSSFQADCGQHFPQGWFSHDRHTGPSQEAP